MCPSAANCRRSRGSAASSARRSSRGECMVFYLADERLRLAGPPYHVNGRVEDDRDHSRGNEHDHDRVSANPRLGTPGTGQCRTIGRSSGPLSTEVFMAPGIPIRQLLIGLDAMEWSLVSRWMAAGRLPSFRRIAENGVQGRLASPARALPDTAWPALSTGMNPAKLGKYFYVQYDPETAGLRYAPDAEIRATPFWTRLDAAGVRAGVVDVPHLLPGVMSRGFSVTNWGTHDNVHHTRASPPALEKEIRARFGTHPVEDCEKFDASRRSRGELRARDARGHRRARPAVSWVDDDRAVGRLFRRLLQLRIASGIISGGPWTRRTIPARPLKRSTGQSTARSAHSPNLPGTTLE